MKEVKGRGGARLGAGRKPISNGPTINVSVKLESEMHDQLKKITAERGMSITGFIRLAIEKAQEGRF